jgi:hypothetical protein
MLDPCIVVPLTVGPSFVAPLLNFEVEYIISNKYIKLQMLHKTSYTVAKNVLFIELYCSSYLSYMKSVVCLALVGSSTDKSSE